MKIEIKNRWNGSVIFAHECKDNTVKLTLLKAISESADLKDANLTRADLTDANLTPVRDDIWSILSSAPKEIPGLISAIKEGRIDGSTYVGSCACLVGTIANIRNVNKDAIPGLSPNSYRPAERFFLGIEKGDTPETNQFSALALQWCENWLKRMQDAFQSV